MELIKIGKINNTHGIKGELKVSGDNPCFRNNFEHPLYINTKPRTEVHINKVRPQGDILLVSFKEYNDINLVECFKGLDILADKDTLDPLEEDEFYINDLIGMEVVNEEGILKGIVSEVYEYPQCYYLEVSKDDKKSLVPFIDEFIDSVNDKVIVKEIEGLFNED